MNAPQETLRRGDLVQRAYGDEALRAERGRVLRVVHYTDGDKARVEWYCAGGATSHSTVKVARLRRYADKR